MGHIYIRCYSFYHFKKHSVPQNGSAYAIRWQLSKISKNCTHIRSNKVLDYHKLLVTLHTTRYLSNFFYYHLTLNIVYAENI